MRARGVYAIARGLFEHERFAPEPFTEREAWIWMIEQAAFRPHCRCVGSIKVELQRGQFAHSLRFMADKWKWPEARVRRFLGKLRAGGSDALIDAAVDAGVTVITLRKYDVYQPLLFDPDAGSDAANDAKKNLLVEEGGGEGGGARAREIFKLSQAAHDLALGLAVIAGHDPAFLPVKWISDGAAVRCQMMLDAGWRPDVMLDAARATMRKKRDGPPSTIKYFEPVFARAHAPQLPLATAPIESTSPEPRYANPGQRPAAHGWQGSRDAFRSARADLKAGLAAAEPSRDGSGDGGGQVVRFAPTAGRG